jgi:hypothetical protein
MSTSQEHCGVVCGALIGDVKQCAHTHSLSPSLSLPSIQCADVISTQSGREGTQDVLDLLDFTSIRPNEPLLPFMDFSTAHDIVTVSTTLKMKD